MSHAGARRDSSGCRLEPWLTVGWRGRHGKGTGRLRPENPPLRSVGALRTRDKRKGGGVARRHTFRSSVVEPRVVVAVTPVRLRAKGRAVHEAPATGLHCRVQRAWPRCCHRGATPNTRASRLGRTDGRRRGEISAPGENPVTLRSTSGFHSSGRTAPSLLVQSAARLALDQEIEVRILGGELEGRALACQALPKSVTGQPVGGSIPSPSAKR